MEDTDHVNKGFKAYFRIKDYRKEFEILIYSAIPLMLNFLNQIFLHTISLFFVGHLGPTELAAITLAGTVTYVFTL